MNTLEVNKELADMIKAAAELHQQAVSMIDYELAEFDEGDKDRLIKVTDSLMEIITELGDLSGCDMVNRAMKAVKDK